MTARDPDSPAAALIENLRAGIPELRARLAAGLGGARAWRSLLEADPALAEDMEEARAEGTRTKTEGSSVGVADEPSCPAPPVVLATPALPAQETLREMAARFAREREQDAVAVAEAEREVALAEEDPLAFVAAQAARFAPGDFGYVLLVDAKCVAVGMPPMSAWWRYSVGEFYATGKPWGIFLVGRGGGKSSTLERVAAAVARYGNRKVPDGQTWTWPFISVGPDDANRRITGVAAVFRADGLSIVGEMDEAAGRKVKAGEGVKIARAPRGSLDFQDVRGNSIQLGSIAGTVGNVSGPSTVGLTIDEAAKLIDARGANPLTEIVTSAAQTSRGRVGWRAIMSSSAFDRAGIHYQMVQAGDTDTNFVARIGAEFIDATLVGFESVAIWEQRRGDVAAAKTIREYAASLTAASHHVPTWTAYPGFGSADGLPWEGAALATRMLVEVLPEEALYGVPRINFWLRECGSLPMDRGGGFDPMRQLDGLASANAGLAAVLRGESPNRIVTGADVPAMKLPGMRPGDARYDGGTGGVIGDWRSQGWDKGDIF